MSEALHPPLGLDSSTRPTVGHAETTSPYSPSTGTAQAGSISTEEALDTMTDIQEQQLHATHQLAKSIPKFQNTGGIYYKTLHPKQSPSHKEQ